MKKSFIVLLHIGFWACYFILIVIMLSVYYRSSLYASAPGSRMVIAFKNILLFAFIPSFLSFYLYYFLLFPKYLQQKKFLQSIIAGLLISACAAVIAYILHRYLIETGRVIDMDEGGKHGRSTAIRVIIIMTFIGCICGMVALVIKGFITWFNEIKLKEALKEKNHEMEMALIKSKLDPHLLFNTINNIDALIIKDAVEASNYLNKLSDIMRFMLYETMADKILLSQEIEYIEKYIALQKIRTANEHYVHFSVTGNIGNKMIAPMVFIPFIENAFKHTNNKKLENAITVNMFISDESIQLVCENKFDSKAKVQQANSGLGNELIQKRLQLIYPGKHLLEVNKTNELYKVNLTITNG
jgi:two-component system, LytTR family, sensor kinase